MVVPTRRSTGEKSCWRRDRFTSLRFCPGKAGSSVGQGAQFFLVNGSLQQQTLLLDRSILQHQHQMRREIGDREHFKVFEPSLVGTRRCHNRRAVQQPRHHRGGQAHPLIQLILHLVELVTNETLLS